MKNKHEFQKELEHLINRFSMENGSNTPDFMLASYLMKCLDNWNETVKNRDGWHKNGTLKHDNQTRSL